MKLREFIVLTSPLFLIFFVDIILHFTPPITFLMVRLLVVEQLNFGKH